MKKIFIFFLSLSFIFSITNNINASAASQSTVNKKVTVGISTLGASIGSFGTGRVNTLTVFVTNKTSKPIYIQKKAMYFDQADSDYDRSLKLEDDSYIKIPKKSDEAFNYTSTKPLYYDTVYGYIGINYKYGSNSKKTKTFTQYGGFNPFY